MVGYKYLELSYCKTHWDMLPGLCYLPCKEWDQQQKGDNVGVQECGHPDFVFHSWQELVLNDAVIPQLKKWNFNVFWPLYHQLESCVLYSHWWAGKHDLLHSYMTSKHRSIMVTIYLNCSMEYDKDLKHLSEQNRGNMSLNIVPLVEFWNFKVLILLNIYYVTDIVLNILCTLIT